MNRTAFLFGIVLLALAPLVGCGNENQDESDANRVVLSPSAGLEVAEPPYLAGSWHEWSTIESNTCGVDILFGISPGVLTFQQQQSSLQVSLAGGTFPWTGEGSISHNRLTFAVSRTLDHPTCPSTETYSAESKLKRREAGRMTGSAHYIRSVPASCFPGTGTGDVVCEATLTFVLQYIEPY